MLKITMNAETMKAFTNCLSTDKTRKALWNVSVRNDGGLVATDGARLAYIPKDQYSPLLEAGQYTVYGKMVKESKYVGALVVEKCADEFPNVEMVTSGYTDTLIKGSTEDEFSLSRTAYIIFGELKTAMNVSMLQELPKEQFNIYARKQENGEISAGTGIKFVMYNGTYFLLMPIRIK